MNFVLRLCLHLTDEYQRKNARKSHEIKPMRPNKFEENVVEPFGKLMITEHTNKKTLGEKKEVECPIVEQTTSLFVK